MIRPDSDALVVEMFYWCQPMADSLGLTIIHNSEMFSLKGGGMFINCYSVRELHTVLEALESYKRNFVDKKAGVS